MSNTQTDNLTIEYIDVKALNPTEYNPRSWSDEATAQLTESIERFGLVDPLVVNSAPNRRNVVIGGHFRLKIAKDIGIAEVPVVYVTIKDLERERELNLRLNKNLGEFDLNLLADFDEEMLADVGFSSEEVDDIFPVEETPGEFNLEEELEKMGIEDIETEKGDIYQLGDHRLMCGDSTDPQQIQQLMDGTEADMCFTDPPYILDYLTGKKKHDKEDEGFGYNRNRRYLETDELPPDFTEQWMRAVEQVAKDDFHIIVFENWKNTRTIWDAMEDYWTVRNMIVWHLPNRTQGYAARYKFFSKYDIALLGSSHENVELNTDEEEAPLQNDYETALYATRGAPHWEGYEKDKQYCPTDFISFKADDARHSGQNVVFGTKPVDILIPYIKVLTQRDDVIIEPFGGSGSTIIAAEQLRRRCYAMEKSPVYVEVIKRRWEQVTGRDVNKIRS